MKRLIGCLPALCLSAGACASTVIYTDSTHPVTSSSPDIPVVYLDAPERVQTGIFGTLPANPALAEKQARDVLNSPAFKSQQQQLASAYQGLMKAWSLGLTKYPAVVFDDKWVIYGTTDVNVAMRYMTDWQGANQ
ncbi:TIGR03757 family integrating conjugative element protein [Prodigiosinella confusarubida]|uniref:TIGR03757 family integrating conjugative element protein n=1 Tax=Serratia sp. (strain ATCC 39006) TaxID=104623 RepID=A0A2I5TBD8_SERS3|nr:TIGR03757 family integrating conjugative element protein [Serratia sp. ATCC 39006]AUH01876.1 TIGR03757 family integrating conjugative element protein [Serratia sp. ATCC 39006]AUH06198.1 TIGR03757 family integrating conjugative element protein [Serratia sp. ATCC 39006]